MANCPVCGESTTELTINTHLDKGCPSQKQQQKQQWSFLTGKKDDQVTEQKSGDIIDKKGSENKPELNSEPIDSSAEPSLPSLGSTTLEPNRAQVKKRKTTEELAPLAERMRPSAIEDYVGQSHLMGPNGVLRLIIESSPTRLPSMVLWGPSGVGKTTLARVLATQVNAKFVEMSAPSAGANDVKKVITDARKDWQLLRRRTILFLDEIHRFSRTQQDSLLAGVERGDVVLIGATTENPSFKLSSALLSRMRVFVLQQLTKKELKTVVERAAGTNVPAATVDLVVDAASATGDARQALNMLETVRDLPNDADPRLILKHSLVYDQRGEFHYDLISAFHKSVRGGHDDAALYYLARMLSGGEDPLYISRRLMRIASEDIGLADDSCLPFAVAVHTSAQQVGMPECNVMLAHAAVKFARARKSVEVYKALGIVSAEIETDPKVSGAPVPMHLRNAPTKLMEDVGYGANYKYNPGFKGEVRQEYLPREIKDHKWLGVWKPTQEDEI